MLRMSMRMPMMIVTVAWLAAATGRAEVRTKTIPYEHDGQTLHGFLAWNDAAEGERPGVLVVHEWWGLNDYAQRRARMLAEMGYVAFAADMYGEGRVTEHAQEAGEWAGQIRQNIDRWRGRAMKGLEVLRAQPNVDGERLAAIGYCFGGATVCQLAYAGADVRGVVSFHGSLPAPDPEQAERITAKMLICHGAADPFVPQERVTAFRDALEEGGVDYQMVIYAGARHSFTNPAADGNVNEGILYNAAADQRSWSHMMVFFEEIFAE